MNKVIIYILIVLVLSSCSKDDSLFGGYNDPRYFENIGLNKDPLAQNVAQNINDIEIPLPTIETQNQIVEELDGYKKIIDGCRQVIENYKPSIDIDPSWEMVELNAVCDVRDGTHDSPKYVDDGYDAF